MIISICLSVISISSYNDTFHIHSSVCVTSSQCFWEKAIRAEWLLPRQNLHFNLGYLYLCFGNWENLKSPLIWNKSEQRVWKCDAGVNCVNVVNRSCWTWSSLVVFYVSYSVYKRPVLTFLYFFWLGGNLFFMWLLLLM